MAERHYLTNLVRSPQAPILTFILATVSAGGYAMFGNEVDNTLVEHTRDVLGYEEKVVMVTNLEQSHTIELSIMDLQSSSQAKPATLP